MADSSDPAYDILLELEDLESLREEMDELSAGAVADLDRLDDPRAATLRAALAEHDLTSLAALDARIAALHRDLDTTDNQSI